MKRLAYFVAAGALTCAAVLVSSDLIGRNEARRMASLDVPAQPASTALAASGSDAAGAPLAPRPVRIVLPAPF